jgi:hypothetical protein
MPYAQPSTWSLPYESDAPGLDSTSRSGAMAIAPCAESIRELYYRWLDLRGPYGATDLEAEAALKIDKSTLIPRRHNCRARVVDSGLRRHREIRSRTNPAKVRIASSKVWVTARWAPATQQVQRKD